MRLEDRITDDTRESLDKAAVENRRAKTKYGSMLNDRDEGKGDDE